MFPAISLPAKPDAYSGCVTVQGKLVSAGTSTQIIEHINSDLIIHTQVNSICMRVRNISRNGMYRQREDIHEEKHVQVRKLRKPISTLIQASGTYLPSASAQQLQVVASSLIFYVCMHICVPSKPQVTEAPHIAS